ncbi:MAG: universal stress protein [Lentisphaerae bacterium]|nr:universal stress protein [Lentisphaerota bacterium]MBT4822002.1 universal stress protein [Lentisphaerota bacterium]MBT5609548.1 universal stress protein [Lentisphaerota bacterium]MBT7058454.1 universal stress protein [Lentisphaerota bacterium]MBT7843163.1 universal stress protein [Lentisphaerota bacterium]
MFLRRKDKSEAEQTEQPATETTLLRHVLLVVDGSEPSMAAARFSVQLAAQYDARITAVYVIDTATMDYLMQMHILVSDERQEFESDLNRTGNRYLDYVKTVGNNNGVEVETVLEKGSFHQQILKVARARDVDAIVVGGWRRTVTKKDAASVERQLILDEASCPVIVVKNEVKRDR